MKHIPFDLEAPLVFRCEVDPWPERMGTDILVFSIRLDLWNRSTIPVERPLILFPQLGLDIRVQPPMLLRPSVSGSRRVLSCTASRPVTIAPQGSLEACRLLFTYDRANGAISFTGPGVQKAAEDIRDFRILCATGGGNFPLRRVELAIPGDLLRAALDSIFADGGDNEPWPAIVETALAPLALTA